MPDYSVHRASELAGDERQVIERWLGRSVTSDETISVNAYRPHPAPAREEIERIRHEISVQAHEFASRAPDVTEEELTEMIDEAIAAVRKERRENYPGC